MSKANYKIRNQSIMEEISENLKKTIKKWNQMEMEEPSETNHDSNLNNLNRKTISKPENFSKNSNEKENNKYNNEPNHIIHDDTMIKEDRIRNAECINNIDNNNINMQHEFSRVNSMNYNNFNKTDSFRNIQQNQQYNNNMNNKISYKQFESTNVSFNKNNCNNFSNSSVALQSNKILDGLDNLNEEMNRDFKEVEEMMESIERELKNFLR